ncbi:MAG: hypothetical protein Ct9H90mP2_13080 [Dehalococcoidia bacterium]|nr:MAG: hypothetical protein Ct9H90mP2_13080 [Dehalococcoidia bacterium]
MLYIMVLLFSKVSGETGIQQKNQNDDFLDYKNIMKDY